MRGCSVLIHFWRFFSGLIAARYRQFHKLTKHFVLGSTLLTQFELRACVVVLALISSFGTQAQFGNEWINTAQQYYKIPVTQRGIYRLTRTDLANAGLPVATIDPRRIQIFRRGTEQAIYFSNNQQPANGVFETGEYLEFYGEANDGVTDVDLYKNPLHHPHAYMNLYSDTAWYFLTWNILPVQGRRMNTPNPELNVGGLPAEVGFNSSALVVLNNQYGVGETYGGRVQSSFFDEGEGWTGPTLCNSGCPDVQDITLSIPQGATAQAPPQLEVLLVGRFETDHLVEVYAGQSTASLRLVGSASFQNFKNAKVNVPLLWTDVAATGNVAVRVKAVGAASVERVSVSYARLDYIRNANLNNQTSTLFNTLLNGGNKSYVEFQNAPAGIRLLDVTDMTDATLIGTYPVGANVGAIINGTSQTRKLFAFTGFNTPSIKRVTFRSINPATADYLIISNSVLRKAGLGFSDPVKAYAGYRASMEGGGYDTLVVNVDQLYNQFNYGETSPRAIYQFMKFMAAGGDPKYLFIIGKGLDITISADRNRVVQPSDFKDLVPPAGNPGSDFPFTAGLNGTTYQHAIATGRLPASTPAEVSAYLTKIVEEEAQPFDDLWKKRVLHLSGGINPGEPQAFRSYVNGFKEKAVTVYYGADVTTQGKQTLAPDEQVNISSTLNTGVSLVTFFGHASSSALDLDVGSINNPDFGYNNVGKYPTFFVNGCNIGRMYSNGRLFPEEWVLAQQKGAKAFIAHSSFGYESYLRYYTDLFYHYTFSDSTYLSRGIGDVQALVADSIFSFSGTNLLGLSIIQQMVLMGDPAIKVFGATKPDYAIENSLLSRVSFDGKPVTAATESFGIQYKIRNYGQARNDSLRVTLTRTFPDNATITYDTIIAPVYFEETFVFVVPNPPNAGGSNSFLIQIDNPNARIELNEGNNSASLNLFIPSSSTYNLFPYPFSIANNTSVELVFQNTNQAPNFRQFLLELDMVPTFSSAFLKQFTISADVLARQMVQLPATDSTVYFWRTRLAQPTANESSDWFTTSFMYIQQGAVGWGQANAAQLSENTFEGLEINLSGDLSFPEKVSTVFIQNFGSANPNPHTNTSIRINSEEFNVSTLGKVCRNNSLNILAFDKTTGSAYVPIPLPILDQRMCGREPQVINNFLLSDVEAGTNGLMQAIQNIAVNDSVVLFTIGNPSVANWSGSVLHALQALGIDAVQLAGFQNGEPLVVFGRKGATPGTARVFRTTLTPVTEQELVVNETITSRLADGLLTSPEIGPAKSWQSLTRKVSNLEATDAYSVAIIGLNVNGSEDILYQGTDAEVDLSFIDAQEFPKLKLQLSTRDVINLTPVDWNYWFVAYEPVAEGILLARNGRGPITLQEGADWSAQYSFVNVTPYNFPVHGLGEQLPVTFSVANAGSANLFTDANTLSAPTPLDSSLIDFEFSSIGFGGNNTVQAEVTNASWREQFDFNNGLSLENYLAVMIDEQPPVLDVRVDGRYLANGDVVSPVPVVRVLLIDENNFWFKTDTAGIVMTITNLDTDVVKRINFSSNTVLWQPASTTNNFSIEFTTILEPGEYSLSIMASDASGNQAADPYAVNFVVSDEADIVLGNPFPNPTTGWISFPVVLSGNSLPTSAELKILSPTGQLIRKVELDEISGWYIGTNYIRINMSALNDGSINSGLYYFRMEIGIEGKSALLAGRILYQK